MASYCTVIKIIKAKVKEYTKEKRKNNRLLFKLKRCPKYIRKFFKLLGLFLVTPRSPDVQSATTALHTWLPSIIGGDGGGGVGVRSQQMKTFSCYIWVPVRSLRLVRLLRTLLPCLRLRLRQATRGSFSENGCDYRSLGMTVGWKLLVVV